MWKGLGEQPSNLSGQENGNSSIINSTIEALFFESEMIKIKDLRSGSNIAKMQQAYVKKNIAESLDSYEIVDVKYLSNEQCHVTTRETYYVQIAGKPLKLLTQQCKYNLVKDSSGWLMTDFAENVKVLSNIHQ